MRILRSTGAAVLFSMIACSPGFAQAGPPPGWNKPGPLPAPNGSGQVTFTHGGTAVTLPLNRIEITSAPPDMFVVSLTYVDPQQENRLELAFSSMPKLGKNDSKPIVGFVVRTKAHGVSKSSKGKTACSFVVGKVTAQDVAGTLSCKGMTDWDAAKPAPDVTGVVFEGTLSTK